MKVNVYIQDAASSIAQKKDPSFTGEIVHFAQSYQNNAVRDTVIVRRDPDNVLVTVATDRCQVVRAGTIKK